MPIELTAAEAYIMKCLWEGKKDLTINEMHEVLSTKYEKPWAYNTVGAFLNILRKKKIVDSYQKGRQYYFYPLVSEEEYKKEQLDKMQNFWYDGSAYKLVASCVENEKLSDQEVKKLRKMLDELRK